MATPGTRLDVPFANRLAGGGRGGRETRFLSVTRNLTFTSSALVVGECYKKYLRRYFPHAVFINYFFITLLLFYYSNIVTLSHFQLRSDNRWCLQHAGQGSEQLK